MNILVLQGSPNSHGSTATLAGEFARGAREAEHSVEVVDVAELDVAPCTGCVACGYEGPARRPTAWTSCAGRFSPLTRSSSLRRSTTTA